MAEPEYRPGSKEDFHRLYQVSYQRVFRTLAAVLADESEPSPPPSRAVRISNPRVSTASVNA
jgi:hypothetical protein